jgi:hypothetical protein
MLAGALKKPGRERTPVKPTLGDAGIGKHLADRARKLKQSAFGTDRIAADFLGEGMKQRGQQLWAVITSPSRRSARMRISKASASKSLFLACRA